MTVEIVNTTSLLRGLGGGKRVHAAVQAVRHYQPDKGPVFNTFLMFTLPPTSASSKWLLLFKLPNYNFIASIR